MSTNIGLYRPISLELQIHTSLYINETARMIFGRYQNSTSRLPGDTLVQYFAAIRCMTTSSDRILVLHWRFKPKFSRSRSSNVAACACTTVRYPQVQLNPDPGHLHLSFFRCTVFANETVSSEYTILSSTAYVSSNNLNILVRIWSSLTRMQFKRRLVISASRLSWEPITSRRIST